MFKLPELPFAYDALQPFMSKETLEYHHDKHHRSYVDTANELLRGTPLEGQSVERVIAATAGDPKSKKLFNNAAQHLNHSLFWKSLKAGGADEMSGGLQKKIEADFGSIEEFKSGFVAQGVAQFGSGWVWLVAENGRLAILTTGNAETPVVSGKTVLLTCDVWEHAYYVDYRNGREKFLRAFVDHLINWEHAEEALKPAYL